MTLALARSFEVTEEGGHSLAPAATAALEKLRAMALKCRANRRLDLDRACRMLSSDSGEAGRAFASALVRTLSQGLGRAPVFYKPGSREVSFDERWLISLMAAVQHDDDAQLRVPDPQPPRPPNSPADRIFGAEPRMPAGHSLEWFYFRRRSGRLPPGCSTKPKPGSIA